MEFALSDQVQAFDYIASTKDNVDSSDDEGIFLKRNSVKTKIVDSDEDINEISPNIIISNDEVSDSEVTEQKGLKTKSKQKIIRNSMDSSDSEKDTSDVDEESENNKSSQKTNSHTSSDDFYPVSSLDKEIVNTPITSPKPDTVPSKVNLFSQSDLYDAEGSDDEDLITRTREWTEETPVSNAKEIRTDTSKEGKHKKPKPKPSKNELQTIHSESQRMVRQSRVSLPYHRPRQRTLAEFLQRRKNTVLPVKSLKTSPAKLGAVWRSMEEKTKEAEEFYKSESSDSDPDDKEKKNELEPVIENPVNTEHLADIAKADKPMEDISSDEPVDITLQESCDRTVVSSESEKLCNSTVNSTLDVTLIDAVPDEKELCSNEPLSSLSGEEKIDAELMGEERRCVDAISNDSMKITDVVQEEHLQEVDKASNMEVTCSASRKESDSDTACNSESLIEVDSCPEKLKENSNSSNLLVTDSNNPLRDIYEVNSHSLGESTGKKSVIEIEMDSSDDKMCNERKPASPPQIEDAESMSLRLDDDSCDEIMKPNLVTSAGNDNSEFSLAAVEKNGLESDKADSSLDCSRLRIMGHVEPILDRKDHLLKSAGITLSPDVLPCLRSDSDVIDLDEDVREDPKNPKGVRDLMQRFIKHHIPKKVKNEEKKVDIGLVVVEGGGDQGPEKVKKEVLTVTVGGGDPNKYTTPGNERPGARLKSLREELQREIARKRDEEWNKRQQELCLDDDEEYNENGSKCNLDDEEEEELTESSSSEEEEEEEEIEDDIDMSTKSMPKSQFVDDEAEESEDEGEMDDESLADDEDEEELLGTIKAAKKKNIKDDIEEIISKLNDEEKEDNVELTPSTKNTCNFKRTKTFDLFCTQPDSIDELNRTSDELRSPPSTPFSQSEKESAPSRGFCLPSPALPLTALQGPGLLSSWAFTQKKLFSDEDSLMQEKDDEESVKEEKSTLRGLIDQTQNSQLCEDELLNLMSGKFLSHGAKAVEQPEEEDFSLALEDTQELFDKSQLKTNSKEDPFAKTQKLEDSKTSGKNFWNDLSLSLNDDKDDDDEDDDVLETSLKRKKLSKLTISDDEDEEEKPNVTDAATADSEDDNVEGEEEANEESVAEDEEESELDEEEGIEERIVEYDSEENAIVVEREVFTKQKVKTKARRGLEFLENEAELSEGEEEYDGSGDEDERGLDKMEREAGDADRLDDEIVRRELGRIHMRQVLDDDKREVRLLQEIFFEDGELHSDGQGRERKFRWRNIDIVDDATNRPTDSGDEEKAEDDDENEEGWRRLRHERETWLREHEKDAVEDTNSILVELGEDSQILKLGKAALRRICTLPSNNNNSIRKWLKPSSEINVKEKEDEAPAVAKEPESPEMKTTFQMLSKRGSFLARKDGTLERLAEMAIKSAGGIEPECLTSKSPVVAKTKNSRKFVFTVLSPEKKDQKRVTDKQTLPEDTKPVKKQNKRKRLESSQAAKTAKKTKSATVGSIFQFL